MPLHITEADLTAYATAVNSTTRSGGLSGVKLLFFLSAMSEPAMLLLLAHRSCKVRPLGGVNVRNKIELLRPGICTEQALRRLRGAVLTASLSNNVRAVKRGFEIDLTVSLNIPTEQSSGPVTAFRQEFTILQFADSKLHRRLHGSQKRVDDMNPTSVTWSNPQRFPVEYNAPDDWAKICKDYNPIHISAAAARIFGFRGKLAHGNHIGALASDCLEHIQENEPLCMEISFKRPVAVPTQLDVQTSPTTSSKDTSRFMLFQILSKNKICIEGRIGNTPTVD